MTKRVPGEALAVIMKRRTGGVLLRWVRVHGDAFMVKGVPGTYVKPRNREEAALLEPVGFHGKVRCAFYREGAPAPEKVDGTLPHGWNMETFEEHFGVPVNHALREALEEADRADAESKSDWRVWLLVAMAGGTLLLNLLMLATGR